MRTISIVAHQNGRSYALEAKGLQGHEVRLKFAKEGNASKLTVSHPMCRTILKHPVEVTRDGRLKIKRMNLHALQNVSFALLSSFGISRSEMYKRNLRLYKPYQIKRTKLNFSIGLDNSATELDPQNPNPRGAHGSSEEKNPLDEIIKTFNERWFHGWDATPEDQRIKFVSISKHIQAHPDYQEKVADNKDAQNRDLAFKKILDEVMGQQRRKELELYKLYAKDDSFYQALFDTMKRLVSTGI